MGEKAAVIPAPEGSDACQRIGQGAVLDPGPGNTGRLPQPPSLCRPLLQRGLLPAEGLLQGFPEQRPGVGGPLPPLQTQHIPQGAQQLGGGLPAQPVQSGAAQILQTPLRRAVEGLTHGRQECVIGEPPQGLILIIVEEVLELRQSVGIIVGGQPGGVVKGVDQLGEDSLPKFHPAGVPQGGGAPLQQAGDLSL